MQITEAMQIVFDRVVNHLGKQMKQSMSGYSEGAMCAYRGAGGAMCAVGCLITDEAYAKYGDDIEGTSVRHLTLTLEESGIPLDPEEQMMNLLARLQGIHDDCGLVGDGSGMRDSLIDLASRAGLDNTVVHKYDWSQWNRAEAEKFEDVPL